MELRHLRYFVAVAEELGFTRAARRLHIAQPPLSQQIRKFEAELGGALFERMGRTVVLTKLGRDLLPEARQLLESAMRFQERAARQARGEQGALMLALISSFATPRFTAMLRAFQKKAPDVHIELSNHPSAWQLEALERGTLDVGILRPRERMPPNVVFQLLRRERLRLAVPSRHPFAKRKSVPWTELRGEPLILVEAGVAPPDYYAAFFERLRDAGVEPSVRQSVQNVATKIWFVSAGLGIAPLPHTPDTEHHSGVVFIDLPADAPVTDTVIAWRKSGGTPALLRFVEFARESFAAR
ncbi:MULTISPECIES: LysR substrate-binding domain-containing protein [Corallococcus]|uniref:LysR substrate-binding domain-containing protein n=1 Tax=Corallococcus TaxID=83461 RepID=UPI001377E556|nr:MULTISPECIES: LysR substrate-binding domain-containing protein [Corallococcus]NBD12029.1 LysR family transcriptional regulator [Corallococcus silvisoli]